MAKTTKNNDDNLSSGNLKPFFCDNIIEQFPLGIISTNIDGKLIYINSAALEILDLNRDKVKDINTPKKDLSIFDILSPGQVQCWKYMITTAVTSKITYSEPRYFFDNGYLEKVLSIKINLVSSADRSEEKIMIVLEDITERILNEKYIILSEKHAARGDALDMVAKKLQSCLKDLNNSFELLGKTVSSGNEDKVNFNLSKISTKFVEIETFISSLADLSQPDTEFISFDLKQLLEEILFSLRKNPKYARIHYTIEVNQDIPNLEIDVGQIKQLLFILLENAAEATFAKAVQLETVGKEFTQEISIGIDYYEDNELIQIKIEDNGVGIKDDIIDKISLLHFTTKKEGNGIGLYNARQIIDTHNGTLEIDSEKNEGATFTLTLPRFQPRVKADVSE